MDVADPTLTFSAYMPKIMKIMNSTGAPANTKSSSTLAYERIHGDIVDGLLQPNERLRIQALSARYSTGASVIREALSRLTANGLVGLEDQCGFFVAPISIEELRDLTSVRIELESCALRKSIEQGGLDWETNVFSAYHRLSRTPVPTSAENRMEWWNAHQRFHDALIEGCGSPVMLRLCRQVLNQLERYRNLAYKHTNAQTRGDAHDEHRALFDAAVARNIPLAQELLTQHFLLTAKVVEDAVFTMPQAKTKHTGPKSKDASAESA